MDSHNYGSRPSTSSSHSNISGSQILVSCSGLILYLPPSRKNNTPFGDPSMPATTPTQRPTITICTQDGQGDVPGSVRNLLLSTKRLQELLKQWSVGQATEGQVSDVYVQIGTEFNTTIRAFACYRIDLRCACPTPHPAHLTYFIAISIPSPKTYASCWNNALGKTHPPLSWRFTCRRSVRSSTSC